MDCHKMSVFILQLDSNNQLIIGPMNVEISFVDKSETFSVFCIMRNVTVQDFVIIHDKFQQNSVLVIIINSFRSLRFLLLTNVYIPRL
jgi:hypothetical protein